MYEIQASFERDDQVIDCSQAEIQGDAYGRTFRSLKAAKSMARSLQADITDFGLDPTTRYTVYEVGSSFPVE